MTEIYDKSGKKIALEEWMELFYDPAYQVLKQTNLANGDQISTVWLGISHGQLTDGPAIFETILFEKDSKEKEIYRYATEELALRHHDHLVDLQKYARPANRWQNILKEIEEDE